MKFRPALRELTREREYLCFAVGVASDVLFTEVVSRSLSNAQLLFRVFRGIRGSSFLRGVKNCPRITRDTRNNTSAL